LGFQNECYGQSKYFLNSKMTSQINGCVDSRHKNSDIQYDVQNFGVLNHLRFYHHSERGITSGQQKINQDIWWRKNDLVLLRRASPESNLLDEARDLLGSCPARQPEGRFLHRFLHFSGF
jgi:hypothetical protein